MLTVGTYSRRGSEGIYGVEFNQTTGELRLVGLLVPLRNPSFQALHPGGKRLYSVCEEAAAGAVASVNLMGGVGEIVNTEATIGRGPCHVAVDPTGQYVVSACYGSGAVVVHPVARDGSLMPASDLQQHAGTGPDTGRQEGPHAHSVNFDPSGRFVIAADLGTDRLMVYALCPQDGQLTLHQEVVVAPGSGPRHFTFHPNSRWAYLITELANTVVAYRWDGEQLTELQTLATLPADFSGTSYCADIHIHPNGRFLYGTNRGHDSLAIFAVDPATGLLEAVGHVPTGGEHPRNFALSPDGNWLLCANQDSDNIVVFRIMDDGARLERVSEFTAIAAPVCLLFM
ncbi:MAG: lactonase family protein [Armatimonadetes bacterium]|nr:lactonase family protein [Armatimonadota bacterium]